MKKFLSFALCIVLLLCLCACGGASEAAQAVEAAGAQAYRITYFELPTDMTVYVSVFAQGEDIYICGMDYSDKPMLVKRSGGSDFSYTLPEDVSFVHACCESDGVLAVLAGDYPAMWANQDGVINKNKQESYALELLIFDAAGELTGSFPLPDELRQGERIRSVRYYEGCYYLLLPACLYQLDGDGALLGALPLDGGSYIAQGLGDSGLYLCAYDPDAGDGGSAEIRRLSDASDFEFEPVASGAGTYTAGFGCAGGALLTMEDGRLYSYDGQGAGREALFDFYRAGITSLPYTEIFGLGDSFLLAGSYCGDIALLSQRGEAEKTELVIWAESPGMNLENYVKIFNQTNAEYEVSVLTLGDEEDSQISAMIASGRAPDIYALGDDGLFKGIRLDNIAEDLYPYLDQYAPGGRDYIIAPVLRASETSGRLYSLPLGVDLYAVIQNTALAPDTGMELLDALTLPEVQSGQVSVFPEYYSREDVWKFLSGLYLENHVDEANASCSFETDEFTSLLKACAMFPVTPAAMEKSMDQWGASVYQLEMLQGIRRMWWLDLQAGDSLSYAPDFGTALAFSDVSLAMSSSCAHKDGAWSFIMHALSSSVDSSFPDSIWPVTQPDVEKLFERASTKGLVDYGTGEYSAISQNGVELCKAIMDSAGYNLGRHLPVQEIMNEEAEKCFSGDCSAEDAAKSIQSRASIYLAEQYG